ncbi:bkd operon transcriptional regulator [Ditylenchus destructor]|nr:bkd operon transcriptional regulator [Ditylenchus destructor]
MDQEIKLDKFDRAILRALQRKSPRQPAGGQRRGRPDHLACWTRIKRLEESGVIEGYTVKVNAEKVGRPEQLIVQLTLNKHTDAAMAEFARHLERSPRSSTPIWSPGDYDYVLRLSVREPATTNACCARSSTRPPGQGSVVHGQHHQPPAPADRRASAGRPPAAAARGQHAFGLIVAAQPRQLLMQRMIGRQQIPHHPASRGVLHPRQPLQPAFEPAEKSIEAHSCGDGCASRKVPRPVAPAAPDRRSSQHRLQRLADIEVLVDEGLVDIQHHRALVHPHVHHAPALQLQQRLAHRDVC